MKRHSTAAFIGLVLTLAGCEKPAPPAEGAAGKRAPCDTDQSCNDDPAVSALWGRCVESVCECQPGAELMPWGRCRPSTGTEPAAAEAVNP